MEIGCQVGMRVEEGWEPLDYDIYNLLLVLTWTEL